VLARAGGTCDDAKALHRATTGAMADER
jgi:hypothetical protein